MDDPAVQDGLVTDFGRRSDKMAIFRNNPAVDIEYTGL